MTAFKNLVGHAVYLQTAMMPLPSVFGLLYEDNRGLLAIDALGQKHWVPWPLVRHLECGAHLLDEMAGELHRAPGGA